MNKGMLLFLAGTACGVAATAELPGLFQEQQVPHTVRDFPDLQKGLTDTPGCLGTQVFAVQGGQKRVIAAWFENRKAMEAWYYGKMHQDAMTKFFPGMGKGEKPFAGFKDETAPLLVIASVTPGTKALPGSNLAVSQIAIEGYTPIPGGVAFGGTFAPENLKVPGLVKVPVTDK